MPTSDEHPAARALAGRHRLRWWEPIPWILALAFYFLFPRHLGFGTELLITILFAISLDLALGYAGIVTLGHAAFFGAGAYTVGMLAHHGIWNEPITGLDRCAAVVAAVIGLLSGPRAAAHHRPDAADADALHHGAAGGGGQPRPRLDRRLRRPDQHHDPAAVRRCSSSIRCIPKTQYLYVLGVLFVCFVFVRTLVYSPFGQSLTGIRENTLRMHAVGAPVRTRLVICYTISAAIAGIAGGAVGAGQRLRQSGDARPRPRRDRADHPGARRLRPALRRLRRRRRLHGAVALPRRRSIRPPGSSASACCWCCDRAVRAQRHPRPRRDADGAAEAQAPKRVMTEPLLETRALSNNFGALAPRATSTSARSRRASRADRPERRRQDHVHQPAHRRAAAERRQGAAQGRRHHRDAAGRAGQARHRPHLPDQPPVPRPVGAGERLHRGRRARRRRARHVPARRHARRT